MRCLSSSSLDGDELPEDALANQLGMAAGGADGQLGCE